MPAVAVATRGATFALRFDLGSWSLKPPEVCEWVVSVDRRSAYRGPLFALFDEDIDLCAEKIDGLSPDYLFGSYRQDRARFSCLLRDECSWCGAAALTVLDE